MKRFTLFPIMFALVCGLAFSTGQAEKPLDPEAEIITISLLGGGDLVTPGGVSLLKTALARLRVDYPNVELKMIQVDTSDGTTRSMDALTKAGTPPDIYTDYLGRFGKFLQPGFALDLSKYMDLSDYLPGSVVEREGQALAVATPGSPQALAVNLDLLREIGYPAPNFDTWTIADFLQLCEAVKQRTDGQKWGTGAFAANPSGDYLMRNWAASFGANFYEDGDYTQTAFKGPAARQTLAFFKTLMERGYIPEESSQLTDDDYVLQWAYGEFAVVPFFVGWLKPYFETAIKQGMIEKPFAHIFVQYPRAPGVERVPLYQSTGGFMAVKSADEERNKILARFVELMNSPESQLMRMYVGGDYPNLKSLGRSKNWNTVNAIFGANGNYDLGMSTETYSETRSKFPELLQMIWSGADQAEALEWYQAEMNKILEKNK